MTIWLVFLCFVEIADNLRSMKSIRGTYRYCNWPNGRKVDYFIGIKGTPHKLSIFSNIANKQATLFVYLCLDTVPPPILVNNISVDPFTDFFSICPSSKLRWESYYSNLEFATNATKHVNLMGLRGREGSAGREGRGLSIGTCTYVSAF